MLHVDLIRHSTSPFISWSDGRYFLITPKLLPGLKYHRNMKVLTINNGKFVPQTLDVGSYIQRARALQEVSS
jgi:hypothetical protein